LVSNSQSAFTEQPTPIKLLIKSMISRQFLSPLVWGVRYRPHA